ncbi:glycoside hydrolase family 28 protein [Roseobacter sp. HKCCA0434]|uniref:polygalacturonase PglA n=1 Tax=Roseobacter sp. HKCCA0434 TaxID=3079297 RepID=UPI002905F0EF|nr:glycosyl hydrolase family 28 protein [Roseobacter sp. HKCCA0434]
MTVFEVLAVTPRTAALLIAPAGARHAQPRPLDWQLEQAGTKQPVQTGRAEACTLFLDDLVPATDYRLATRLGEMTFRTSACAGLVDITDHGAAPDTDCTEAIAHALDAVPEGGTLHIPPGRYETRPLFLRPNMVLHLAGGAELAAPASRADWPQLPARDRSGRPLGSWEGLPENCFAALITAIDCPRLAITGRGTLDGGGDRGDWWSWPKETRDGARRPRLMHLLYCDDVILTGVTCRNAPSWTIHPYRCDRLRAAALTILNPKDSPNTDGFNPESCTDARLTGLDFSVGDDCIAIKAGKRGPAGEDDHLAPCTRLSIRHSRMQHGHGAVVIGSEMSGGVENVRISACDFVGTDRGLRLKTRRGRGGRIRNIVMEDVAMTGVATPLAINAFYFCDPDGKDDWVQSRAPRAVDENTPVIENVALSRVTARDVTCAGVAILGLPEAPVSGIRLDDVSISVADAPPAPPLMALHVAAVAGIAMLSEFAEVSGTVDTVARTSSEETPC